MQESDRRYRQRFDLKVPLKIRNIDAPEVPEQLVESSDISARGLYSSTDVPLDVGTRVELFLTMPAEISEKESRGWRCTGRVVRVEPACTIERKAGNGVEILCYEILDSAQSGVTMGTRFNRFPPR